MCTRNNPREKYAHTKTRVDSVINGVQWGCLYLSIPRYPHRKLFL